MTRHQRAAWIGAARRQVFRWFMGGWSMTYIGDVYGWALIELGLCRKRRGVRTAIEQIIREKSRPREK